MVKDRREKRCPFRLRLRMLLSVASLFLSKEGRMVTRFFSGVEEIDQQLLQDTQTEYQGEIAFFAVNSRYRGIGLGKKLFDAAQDYMRTQRIRNFSCSQTPPAITRFMSAGAWSAAGSASTPLRQRENPGP